MKKTILALVMMVSPVAMAQPRTLIMADSGPGYVSPKDQYYQLCVISEDGDLKYTYESPKKNVEWKDHLSAKELVELKRLMVQAKAEIETASTTGVDYPTYSGDAPDFGIEIYPNLTGGPDDSNYLVLRGQGMDHSLRSPAAKAIEKSMGDYCKMSREFRRIRRTLRSFP